MPAGALFLIDPSLQDQRGHHYQLALAITGGARDLGRRVVWLANKNAPVDLAPPGVELRRVFRMSMYEAFGAQAKAPKPAAVATPSLAARVRNRIVDSPNPVARTLVRVYRALGLSRDPDSVEREEPARPESPQEVFANDLREGLAGAPRDAVTLMTTADGITYRAMLVLAIRHPEFFRSSPAIHLCTPYDTGVMPHARKGLDVDRVIFYLEKLGLLGTKIFLHAENPLLADWLSSRWNLPVSSLDLPPPAGLEPDGQRSDDRVHLEVCYLGAAREEKGFHRLPEIVRKVQELDHQRRIRFFIQCPPQVLGYPPIVKQAVEELEQMRGPCVEVDSRSLSSDDYMERLRRSDVVLMLYQPDRYRVRGSGVAVEAVASGCVVVCASETFPAYVAGNSACIAETTESVVTGLLQICESRESWLERARERARYYHSEFQATRYVNRLNQASDWLPGENGGSTCGLASVPRSIAAAPRRLVRSANTC